MDETTLIFESVHGSQAYGLAREGSDLDLKGVIVGPAHWYFGFRPAPEQVELHADHFRFEVRKFFRLLANANPTILELLFTDESDHHVCTPAGRRMLDVRDAFLTKRVGQTFGGYAMGQLKRIKTHRRWLLDPPKTAPTREAFSLPERRVIPKDQLGAAETLIEKGKLAEADVSTNFLEVLGREKRYKAARAEWQQFNQWKQNRNEKRAALEAKHGYDTKHAMHLVRLLRMGHEILQGRGVIVKRPDRDDLLAVRDGAWSYDQLIAHAEAKMTAIGEAKKTSALPDDPDEAALEALCVSIVEEVLLARRA